MIGDSAPVELEQLQDTVIDAPLGAWAVVDDPGVRYRELQVLTADPDVSVGLCGLLDDHAAEVVARRPFAQDWVVKWGWRPPRWWFADILYRGEIADRSLLMTVDAGRAVLPAGNVLTVSAGDVDTSFGLIAYEFDYQLGRHLHGLALGDTTSSWNGFDRYFLQSSIVRDFPM